MNILVTAGNTQVFIDKVRSLTNIFTGRTGAAIALEAYRRGHRVTLLTSHPEVVEALRGPLVLAEDRWAHLKYQTFEDLQSLLARNLLEAEFDAVIHSAAVSDYLAGGIYSPSAGTRFQPENGTWQGKPPILVDRAAGKVKSDEAELWLRLVRAPKLVNKIRAEWHFKGVLVKFKLEVGIGAEQLLDIAEQSRRHSQADLMVANTLEGAGHWAYLGPLATGYERISRRELAAKVMEALEGKYNT